jgi:hypothetical protein
MSGNKGYKGCDVCGKELLLFKCKYCGKVFCGQHKAPEMHNCAGLPEYYKMQATGTTPRPGDTSDVVEKSDERPAPSRLVTVYKGGVFAVKVLSVIAVTIASVLAFVMLIGYINANMPTGPHSIPVSNSTGATVMLTDDKNATDPTWAELMEFLRADDTIKNKYTFPDFTCADFARTLHDNAEASGIACGFVAIEFLKQTINYSVYDNGDGKFLPPDRSMETGHGLNVFKTTDRGFVYVDASSQSDLVADQPEVRIAYLVEGREFNEIDLDWATDINYSFYEAYKQAQLDFIADQRVYYKDLAIYNDWLTANKSIMNPVLKAEKDRLNTMAVELNARKSQIGPFYFPPGIVKKADTYW